jgi:hypothetical protein
MCGQVLAIYGQDTGSTRLDAVQAPAERHLTERTVVSIGLSIRCKVNKAAPGRRGEELAGEAVTILEQVTKSH